MHSVRSKAREIIAQFGTDDPYSIAKSLNIAIYERDMPPRVKGILYNTAANVAIALNKNLTYPERRAALAHELGHYFLHPHVSFSLLLGDRIQQSRRERQADEFAACLLIGMDKPPEGVPLWELAERFDVSESLVRLRFSEPE